MKKFKLFTILTFVTSAFVLSGCKKDDPTPGPYTILNNPYVKAAINQSSTSVYYGTNPPALAGTYSTNGSVTDASSILSSMTGASINTVFVLSNQTTSGKIDFEERVSGITASGTGGYIIGANGNFTIVGESPQSGSKAGLPDGVSITVALVMSGTQSTDGNLTNVEGLSVITKANSTNPSYNVSVIQGAWWKWDATFYLQQVNSSPVKSAVNCSNQILIQKALQSIMK